MWSTIACNGNFGRLNLDYNRNPHSSIASRVGGSLLSLPFFLFGHCIPYFSFENGLYFCWGVRCGWEM